MSNERITDNLDNEELDEETTSDTEGSGISDEITNQLSQFAQSASDRAANAAQHSHGSDSAIQNLARRMGDSSINSISFGVSEDDRTAALKTAGQGLSDMVMGDLPKLRERMTQLGLDTTQLDEKIKEAEAKVEQAKPLQEALLKGDITALQNLVKTMKPEDLQAATELIQQHFDRSGAGLQVEFSNGQLIVSANKGDRAVAISADKTDVIGINPDGSYDFNRQFRRENPANEMRGLGDQAVGNLTHRNWKWDHKLLDGKIQGLGSGGGSAVEELRNLMRQPGSASPEQGSQIPRAIPAVPGSSGGQESIGRKIQPRR